MNKTLLDTPKYFMELYHKSLREIRKADLDSRLNFPKWKRDIRPISVLAATHFEKKLTRNEKLFLSWMGARVRFALHPVCYSMDV